MMSFVVGGMFGLRESFHFYFVFSRPLGRLQYEVFHQSFHI